MKLVKFEAEHLAQFANYGGQESQVIAVEDKQVRQLAEGGPAFTGMVDDRVIACGGLFHVNQYRATAWALLQADVTKHFIAVHRATLRVFRAQSYQVIEAYCDPRSERAMNWLPLLGFELVRSYKPFFFPDGSGASEWARYKD